MDSTSLNSVPRQIRGLEISMDEQQAIQYARGLIDRGMSVADANVEIVRMMGVNIIKGRIPREIRRTLLAAVKAGKLGRLAREGAKPEVFFHPNSIYLAKEKRNKEANAAMRAIMAVCA